MGFEPTTASLEGWNSTTELRPPILFTRCVRNSHRVIMQACDFQAEHA
jgi:hypothetical protein